MAHLDAGTFEEERQAAGAGAPSAPEPILSTDDLVFEIGLKAVQLLERQKIIERLQKQLAEMGKLVAEAEAARAAARELRESNKALSAKNLEMDKALTAARQELEDAKAQIRELTREVGRLEKKLEDERARAAELAELVESLERKLKRKKKK